MTGTTRTVALAMTGLIALGSAAACGSSSSGGSSASSTPSSASTPSTASTPAGPVASIPNLTGVHTQVTLDAGFLKALTSLKVKPGLIGKATLSKAGVLTFPITGGSATYYKPGTHTPYVLSNIKHNGSGITLTAGGKTVGLSNFVVNAGTSELTGKVTLNGKLVAKSTNIFFLNGRTLQPLATGPNSTAILEGTKVFLDPAAAATLNKVYGISALSGSTLVGVAKITLKVPSS